MSRFRWYAFVLMLAGGCSCQSRPAADRAEPTGTADPAIPSTPAAGPGLFHYSAIRATVGPADGPATELILSEQPITEEPTGTHVAIGLHGSPHQWSGKSARVAGRGLEVGWGTFWSNGDGQNLKAAEVRFGRVAQGEPVEGEYDITFADGTRARGRFRATWLPKLPAY